MTICIIKIKITLEDALRQYPPNSLANIPNDRKESKDAKKDSDVIHVFDAIDTGSGPSNTKNIQEFVALTTIPKNRLLVVC